MKTAVVAVAKMENNYVREWTEWYKSIGFTNVIIFDNNDYGNERIIDVIRDYVDDGFARVLPLHNFSEPQYTAYQSGYGFFGREYDWIAFFDIDEFLVLNDRFENNIENYLSMECFSNADIIRVPWREYGDNGLVRVKDGDYSLMKRFTKPFSFQRRWTKAIVRGGIPNFAVHHSDDGIPHLVLANGVRNAVDANGRPTNNFSIRGGCGYENVALNHYSMKTIEEFVTNKIKKGWALSLDPNALNKDMFFQQNKRTQEKEDLYNELVSGLK